MNLGANFMSKMSKLLGEVGRVDRRIFVLTCFLSILGYRVDPFWTYVQNFVISLLDPLQRPGNGFLPWLLCVR